MSDVRSVIIRKKHMFSWNECSRMCLLTVLTKNCHHHATHVCQSDGVLQKEQGHCDHCNSFSYISHSIGEGSDQLEQGEGENVLQPVKSSINKKQESNVTVDLTWNLRSIKLKKIIFFSMTVWYVKLNLTSSQTGKNMKAAMTPSLWSSLRWCIPVSFKAFFE